jgi:23S rRNA (cytidine1920-2'-O)/16S rRNA (cytidine1409-2'-O)-methyltransferase
MTERQRLDSLVWQRGLAPSRAQARALVLAGAIAVDGQCLTQAGTLVPPQAELTLLKPPPRYVSRGGDKLAAALDAFPIDVRHRIALDIGASTGGFTDCLLQAGARRVHAVDVGYGQLHWRLRTDPRVIVYERTNARYLRLQDLSERASVSTVDVAFISLRLLLPILVDLLEPEADVIALIKPQFEVGKGQVGKGGVVRHPRHHYQALMDVLTAAQACGFGVQAGIASPLLGPKGNREFLAHCRLAGELRPSDDLQALCQRLAMTPDDHAPPPAAHRERDG